MGIDADFFDYHASKKIGLDQMKRILLTLVKGGKYDVVFIATHKDEFDEETLNKAKRYSTIIAWNSDDEWRWETYSKHRVGWYTFMVTNSPEVFEKEKSSYGNLIQAQWACTSFWDGEKVRKDIDFSFAGRVYGERKRQLSYLKSKMAIITYGYGTGNRLKDKTIPTDEGNNPGGIKGIFKNILLKYTPTKVINIYNENFDIINFEQVNKIWNRTKISFTPLDSSKGNVRQIKSRVFDMGLSRTLMLAHKAPYIDNYYEPQKEFVVFDTLGECVDKAKYYLRNESERKKISEAYARRTLAEHLWKHRIEHVLREAGLKL